MNRIILDLRLPPEKSVADFLFYSGQGSTNRDHSKYFWSAIDKLSNSPMNSLFTVSMETGLMVGRGTFVEFVSVETLLYGDESGLHFC